MPLLNRHGVHLYYEVHGSGRPLILSHGFSANCAMWYLQIEELAKHFKVILWDMRGHGRSDYPDDQALYSEAHTVEDIAAILDETCGRESKAIVGGLSLGGYMSMAFYKTYPARVTALLILDTGPRYTDEKLIAEWNQRVYAVADQLEASGVSLLEMTAATPERKRALHHRNVKGIARAAKGMLAQHTPGVSDILTKIKVPSLVLVGADDEQFLPTSELMGKTIPGAKYVVLEDAGHAANFDQPEAFLKAVMEFLEPFSAAKANL